MKGKYFRKVIFPYKIKASGAEISCITIQSDSYVIKYTDMIKERTVKFEWLFWKCYE